MRTGTLGVRVVLGGLMVCAATTAAGKDSGFYLGADAGYAGYPDDANLQVGSTTLTEIASTDSVFTAHVAAGLRFSRYFALEAGYVDLGEVKATLTDAAQSAAIRANLRFKARGPILNAIGSFPLGNWDPFIKFGMFWQNVDLNLDGTAGGTPFSLAWSADGMKIAWGAGVGYALGEQWHVRLELDYFDSVGDDNRTGKARVTSAAVGVAYRF
jgi:OmpA-OmpF porin, OOP family